MALIIESNIWRSKLFKISALLFVFCSLALQGFAQKNFDEKLDVAGTMSVTNNGISTVPSLALNKSAALFTLSVGKRFRFDPEFRFSMEGKPWSFIFRFRYDIIKKDRLQITIGGQPAFSFKTIPALVDEIERDAIEARRFLAGELTTSYRLTHNMNVGSYYLYSHGFDPTVPDNTHYLSLFSSIPNISLISDLFLNIRPQIYYLKIDELDGFYAASSIAIGVKDIPVTVSSTINKVIDTEINNTDPLWNISLNYSFRF